MPLKLDGSLGFDLYKMKLMGCCHALLTAKVQLSILFDRSRFLSISQHNSYDNQVRQIDHTVGVEIGFRFARPLPDKLNSIPHLTNLAFQPLCLIIPDLISTATQAIFAL
jgi:hypothetical protein